MDHIASNYYDMVRNRLMKTREKWFQHDGQHVLHISTWFFLQRGRKFKQTSIRKQGSNSRTFGFQVFVRFRIGMLPSCKVFLDSSFSSLPHFSTFVDVFNSHPPGFHGTVCISAFPRKNTGGHPAHGFHVRFQTLSVYPKIWVCLWNLYTMDCHGVERYE